MKRTLQTAVGLAWFSLPGMIAQSGWANSLIQGVVYEKTTEASRPLAGAFVSVWSSRGEILATIRADGQGHYEFVNLPPSRLELTASKAGYLTRQASGRPGSRAVVDCSTGCLESGINFELFRGSVVAGVVLDGMGEPVSRAAVSVSRNDASAPEKPSNGSTDNQGRFRIAGLRAGSYTLAVQRRAASGQDEAHTKTLEVRDGEQIVDLSVTLGGQDSYRVAGNISGIPFGEGFRTWVEIRPLNGSARSLQASVSPEGRFQFDSIAGGRYRADAAVVKLGSLERSDYFLNAIEVVGETGQLTLQPLEPAAAVGMVEIAAGAPLADGVIRFTSKDGFGYRWIRVQGADRPFELSGLRPGTYRVEADSMQFYVKGVKTAGKIESPNEVILSPGMNRLTVVVAADHARVFGIVRGAPETDQPLPQGRIALRGDRGTYSVQADQAGSFLFTRVIPGEYRVCAWTNLAPERVEDEMSWKQAGCQLRTISIGPSSQIQINLRAAP